MDRGAWQPAVHRIAKSDLTRTCTHTSYLTVMVVA